MLYKSWGAVLAVWGVWRQIVSLITNKNNSTYISNDKLRPVDRRMTSNGEDNLQTYKLNGNRGMLINKSRFDSLCTDHSCL